MAERSESCPILVKQKDDLFLVRPDESHITGDAWVEQMREKFELIISQAKEPRVVLDLARVEHVSSAILGELISAAKHIRKADGQLHMCGVQPALAEIFAITRLNQSFRIHEDCDAAVRALS